MMNAFLREFGNDFADNRLCRRRDVVNGNDQEILGRASCRDDGQKLGGRNRGHCGKFSTPSSPRTRANYFAILTIKSKSLAVSGMTDNRDCRTSAIFLGCDLALISARVTGRDNFLSG